MIVSNVESIETHASGGARIFIIIDDGDNDVEVPKPPDGRSCYGRIVETHADKV